ncbi:glutaminase A [Streptomyces sp. NPDC058653]|uniref:glutaminase A n=1 Tax=Streptomyces sp. NPDC058653 TaxID=3346576 RepID=UPI0036613AC0
MTSVPATDVITDALVELQRRVATLDEGEVASYIPQLATADPRTFGIALTSMGGNHYWSGGVDTPFTLQSVSKPFVYALVLAELGLDEVTRWVGAEPSGEAYNAISLEPNTGRPANAMINAGAIVTTALVPGRDEEERFERILDCLGRFAGRRLDVDERVWASESETGDRNRALTYLMRGAGSLPGSPDGVETYFRQCSVRVTTADLAVMAATLANGGVNPSTGETVVPEPVAVQVLAVMASCGMYNASGDWLLRVGLPAKSGVSGGLIAASPARFGLAVHSPPLDPMGTPVRGVAVLRELSTRFGLHLMRRSSRTAPTVKLAETARTAPSDRPRSDAEREVIERAGDNVAIVAAQGILDFTETERLLHELGNVVPDEPGWVVLDLEEVSEMRPFAEIMLREALTGLASRGHQVTVVGDLAPHPDESTEPGGEGAWRQLPSRETAVGRCEDALLSAGINRQQGGAGSERDGDEAP